MKNWPPLFRVTFGLVALALATLSIAGLTAVVRLVMRVLG